MARRRRCLVAGGYYHVINRGNNRATLFRAAGDYELFLGLISRGQQRLLLPILAFALMPNHFHMVVKPEHRNDIGKWLHWVLTTHAIHHHRERDSSGHVWQGRFKAFPIEPGRHLLTVVRYVERNPLRAGLVRRCADWPWSSAACRDAGRYGSILDPKDAINLPPDWRSQWDCDDDADDLVRVRECVNRQQPFGGADWVGAWPQSRKS